MHWESSAFSQLLRARPKLRGRDLSRKLVLGPIKLMSCLSSPPAPNFAAAPIFYIFLLSLLFYKNLKLSFYLLIGQDVALPNASNKTCFSSDMYPLTQNKMDFLFPHVRFWFQTVVKASKLVWYKQGYQEFF